MVSSKNFCISLTPSKISQYSTFFTFSYSIFIPLDSITTLKNTTFLTFYLYFSGFTYRSFSTSLFTISSTISLCFSFSSIPTITLLMKLATSPVLIKFYRILFIIIWNIARKFISPKNITVSSNNPFRVVNAAFYSFPSFIYILLYLYHNFNFVNTFLVPIFSTISKIRDKG